MRSAITTLLLTLLFAAPAAAAPNVVVIETDDQTAADMVAMPRTNALIGGEGVTFANSFVSLSECCPSRATFLTGQYAHNHGVRSIRPPFGGFAQLDGSETLAVWLRRAGYATGMVGKYLNGYGNGNPPLVPPGWTDFEGLLGRSTYRFYDYTLNANGRLESPGRLPDRRDHRRGRSPSSGAGPRTRRSSCGRTTSPRTPAARATSPIRRTVDSTVPATRHGGAFLGVPLPRPPSFNEADMSDKPPRIRRRPPLKQWQIAALAEVAPAAARVAARRRRGRRRASWTPCARRASSATRC